MTDSHGTMISVYVGDSMTKLNRCSGPRILLFVTIAIAALGCPQPTLRPPHWMPKAAAGEELFATFHTSEGVFVARLFSKDAPRTVENFVGLAAGEKEWTHPRELKPMRKPL